MEEKIKEVFGDEEFVKSLLALETPEEVQAKLGEKGIDLSIEEIIKTRELLIRKANGELSDEELEEVAGGFDPITLTGLIISCAVVAFIGGGLIGCAVDNYKRTGSIWAKRGW